MKTVCLVTLLWAAPCVCAGTANGQQLQVSRDRQDVVARLLFSQDRTEAWDGLSAAQQIPPAEQNDGLRGALIALLDAKNVAVARAALEGVALDTREDPEFIAQLSQTVASIQDPRAIPTLAEAIYGGEAVADALAKNGDAAVPAIVRVVTSESAHYDAVDFGLTD